MSDDTAPTEATAIESRPTQHIEVRVAANIDDIRRLRLLVSQIGFALDGYLADLPRKEAR